jgi:hypothetical protein
MGGLTQYLDIWDQIREQIANHIQVELPTVSDNENFTPIFDIFSVHSNYINCSKDLRMDFQNPLKDKQLLPFGLIGYL